MPKPPTKTHSRYSRDAAALLGKLIRTKRIEHKLSEQMLAERAGISRSLLQRIEKGELTCSIGAVFEVAAIVGIALFEEDKNRLQATLYSCESKLTLLPKAVRKSLKETKDDF
jgi:ribosome-binding protein aMBF1 (putative translation factor)